jgi:hypothetical protein
MGGEYMKPLTRGVVALALVMVLAVVAAYGTDWAKAKDKSPGASGTASAADTTAAASAATSASSEERCGPLGDGRRVPIATSKLLVEYNATDGDLGVHGAFDDDGWSKLCVYDPNGDLILKVGPQSQLKDLTMAGIFFESREPPLKEFTFRDLKDSFPEGRYEVRGRTFDGKRLVGDALFTHDIPKKPRITAPAKDEQVDPNDLNVRWKGVTETTDGNPVDITGYEVIVTKEVKREDPHGFSKPIYDVHVPPDHNSLSVPAEFLEPNTEYELEVLALEKSDNRTINVRFFTTP